MDLSLLEEKLSGFGSSGYYLFESFIIKLLQIEAQSNGQTLIYHSGSNVAKYDAIAPEGFSDINGFVAIEIVKSINPNRLYKEIFNYSNKLKNNKETLLLVTAYTDYKYDNKLIKEINGNDSQIIIWGQKEVQRLIDKHKEAAENIAENLFHNRFKVAFESQNEDWKEQRKILISAIRDIYISGRFSIFLGAGVSSSAGLPDWDTLLNSLFVSMLTEDGLAGRNSEPEQISSIVKRLRQIDGPSALTLARYLRKGITADSQSEQGKFIEAVTAQLYSLRNKKFAIDSPLIKSIASLCAPTRTGANVRSVITYNFDDILERELENRGESYRSIFEEIDLPSPEELPIYHVHGFLPEKRDKYNNINKATLVFSEEGYHHIYRDAYHWSNLIQLNSLKETSCLMIGLSLTDPNLRRLLEISAKSTEKPKHFAFMRRISFETFSHEEGKNIIRAPVSLVRKFLDRHHKLNEEVLRELGVNIIWYEEYSEIPSMLQKISKGI